MSEKKASASAATLTEAEGTTFSLTSSPHVYCTSDGLPCQASRTALLEAALWHMTEAKRLLQLAGVGGGGLDA